MVDNKVHGAVDRATSNNGFEYAARIGYSTSGVLHLLIAYIVVRLAFGSGGNADQSGALATLAAQPGATGSVPVIVTLVPAVTAASFTPAGMQVAHRFVSLNAVAGMLPISQLNALAASPEVLRIERDGEMKTLSL